VLLRAPHHRARLRADVVDDVLHPHHALEELDLQQVLHVALEVGRERLEVLEIAPQRVLATGAHARHTRHRIDLEHVLLDPHPRVRHRDVGQPALLGLALVAVVVRGEVSPCEGFGERGREAADDPLGVHA